MRKYKVGQLSKVMGVSPHLLKHYEKYDLVIPVKDDTTNYRYYDISQCSRIIESKKYRNVGFSLKETSQLLNDADNDILNQMLSCQITNIEEQIEKLIRQKEMALLLYEDSKKIDEYLNQWFIEKAPNLLFLKQSNNRDMLEEGRSVCEKFGLIEHVPSIKSAVYLKQECFHHGVIDYHWGIILDKEKIKIDPNEIDDCFILCTSSRFFVSYVKVPSPFMDNKILIIKILEKYNEFAETINADVLAVKCKEVHEKGKEYHYFKIYIPIG